MKCYLCSQCNKISSSAESMLKHIEIHDDCDASAIQIDVENYENEENVTNSISAYFSDHSDEPNVIHQKNLNPPSPQIIIEESEIVDDPSFSDKPFRCNICMKSFAYNVCLTRHLMTHTGEKPFPCNFCSKRFTKSSDLKRHIMTHTGEKPYECPFCQHKFSAKGNLKTHIRKHSKEKPYKCHICNRGFAAKGALDCHVRIHTGEKPFSCDLCGRKFTQKCQLLQHTDVHHGKNFDGNFPFECNICSRKFRNNLYMKRHLRIHSEGKIHKCTFCDKSYYHKSNLITHLETHSKGQTMRARQDQLKIKKRSASGKGHVYVCPLCDKEFKLKHGLLDHIRVHTGEKPFHCQTCNKRFTQHTHLKIHQIVHTKERPFECELCGKKFRHKRSLTLHCKRHTNEENPGEISAVKDADYSIIRPENLEETFSCSICGKQFLYKRSLFSHYKAHQEVNLLSEKTSDNEGDNDATTQLDQNVLVKIEIGEDHLLNNEVLNIGESFDEIVNIHPSINGELSDDCHVQQDNSFGELKEDIGKPLSETHQCHKCHQKFDNDACLENHFKICLDKTLERHVLIEEFLEPDFKSHLISPSSLTTFICNICDKGFLMKDGLDSHICDEFIDKSYKCEDCGLEFTDEDLFYKHQSLHEEILHSSEEEFGCQLCPLKFDSAPKMKQHLLTHKDDKPYQCHICPKTFAYKNTLEWHIEEFHFDKTFYECDICQKRFKKNYHFQIHKGKHKVED